MSTQIICDDCGEPVDETQPHYQLTGSKVQLVDGVLTVVDAAVTLHYHDEHLPVYKIGGQPVDGLPSTPTPEPTPESETPTEVAP